MKKIYKIIASISVFLIVLFVGVVLVVGNTNKKANAGVIINHDYSLYSSNFNVVIQKDALENKNNLFYLGFEYYDNSSTTYFATYPANSNYNNTNYAYFSIRCEGFRGDINNKFLLRLDIIVPNQYASQTGLTPIYDLWYDGQIIKYNEITYFAIDYNAFILKLSNDHANWQNFFNNNNYEMRAQSNYSFYFTASNYIAPCSNIYDLENKSFCLLYLSDISGIDTAQMRDEITINWGFIDSTDNELYAEYSPTISAQNLAVDNDTIIRLGVPLNNKGSAMHYYDVSQKALLSTIDSSQGGATATAHIYGIYVWRNLNMIEWGLAEFDTTSTPTSGATMNYLTSTTRKYQYQNIDTSTMTCRLSVSSNFNFITIKNQEQVDVSSVNAVIRQGGFMPAWALYNWARGSHSGFTSGEQYGTAQYQQGQPGYNAIYQAGRQAGLNENIGTQNWFIKIFEGVDSFLNIRIFPNITFGVLLGIPFVISVVWFIIRSFRGGGGS